MKKRIILHLLLLAIAVSILGGCLGTNVYRVRASKTTDISGRWNDTDARLVAKEMIRSMLSHSWILQTRWTQGHKPVVIVGEIENLTSEHIETETFIKDIERELINSGRVKFVASRQEREEVREEKEDQQTQATRQTMAQLRKETGADYMLKGKMKLIIDAEQGKQVKFYQVDLELIDIESIEKVWIDTMKIKKIVTQSPIKW